MALLLVLIAVVPVATAQETIELRLWMHQNTAFIAGNEALVADFEAANPNVNITIESFEYDVFIQTSMVAGNEADIIQMFGSWVCSYTDRLAVMPDSVMPYAEASELYFAATLNGYY